MQLLFQEWKRGEPQVEAPTGYMAPAREKETSAPTVSLFFCGYSFVYHQPLEVYMVLMKYLLSLDACAYS